MKNQSKFVLIKTIKKNIDLSNDNSLIIITKNEFSPDNSLSIKCSAPVPIIIKSEKQYNALRYFLNNIFRFKEFRPGQKEIIKRVLELKNTVGLLPTSAGKSLCYQLIMFIQPAPIIIIEPIKSLIIDQFYNLSNRFLIDKVGKISSDQTLSEREEVQKKFRDGQYLALYITPERFQVSTFRNYLSEFIKARPIAYAVIDEAHCVSEWGHDFRTSYLALSKTIRRYCNHNGYIPCFYALTGTASEVVLRDILSDLEIIDQEKEAVIRNYSFDRKELDFRVVKCISSEKFYYLKSILNEVKDELKQAYKINQVSDLFNPIYKVSGLIFCPHVNSTNYSISEINDRLGKELNLRVVKKIDLGAKEIICPKCGSSMKLRTNRYNGSKFYGCSKFPECRYTLDINYVNKKNISNAALYLYEGIGIYAGSSIKGFKDND